MRAVRHWWSHHGYPHTTWHRQPALCKRQTFKLPGLQTIAQFDLIPQMTYITNDTESVYSGFVDNRALVGIIKAFSTQQGKLLTTQELKDIESNLKNITFFIMNIYKSKS